MASFDTMNIPARRLVGGRAARYRGWLQAALCTVLTTVAVTVPHAQTAQSSPRLDTTVLARAAQTVGIRQCFQAVDQVASRVLFGSQKQDVVLDWNHITPDKAPFFALTGFERRANPELLSLSTIPDNLGHCAILAEHISVDANPCARVAKQQLIDYRGTPLVTAITVYTLPSRPRETVTLADVGGACLIVRRQVEYEWPAVVANPTAPR